MNRALTTSFVVGLLVALPTAIVSCDREHQEPNAVGPAAASNGRKQLWHCGMHPQVIQDHPGDCPICHMALTPMGGSAPAAPAERTVLYWWDPMVGPSSISDRPGKSAMGMDL